MEELINQGKINYIIFIEVLRSTKVVRPTKKVLLPSRDEYTFKYFEVSFTTKDYDQIKG